MKQVLGERKFNAADMSEEFCSGDPQQLRASAVILK